MQSFSDLSQEEFECAVTGRFQRLSMPYERVEIEPLRGALGVPRRRRTSTFAHTIRRPHDRDAAWFELPEAALIAIEAPAIPDQAENRRWVAAALVATAIALPVLWLLCSALPSLLS